MADYNRVSRECKFEELGPDSVAAIKAHLDKYEFGPILNDSLICIDVKSEKRQKGLFAGPGPKFTEVALILTPRWLVQTIRMDKKPIVARSALLEDITVTDYEKNPYYKQFPDHGVEVTGRFTGASESSTSFIGLGTEAAGLKFKEMLFKAVQDAKK
jgi:hypothetical protein